MANLIEIVIKGKDEFSRTFDDANGAVETHSSKISGLGAALGVLATSYAAVKIVDFVKDQIDAADALNKTAQKTGITVESLGELNYAASLADVSSQELANGVKFLSKAIGDSKDESSDAAKTFAAMGIAVKDSSGNMKKADDVMKDVAAAFSTMEDGVDKTNIALKLFGRAGTEMIPLLNSGRDGLAQMANEAHRAGVVMSSETAKAAEDFNDGMTRLKANITGAIMPAMSGLIKILNDVAKAFGLQSYAQTNKIGPMIDELVKLNATYKSQKMAVEDTSAAAVKGNAAAIAALIPYKKAAEDTLNKIKELESAIGKLAGADQTAGIKPPTKSTTAAAPKESGNELYGKIQAENAREWLNLQEEIAKKNEEYGNQQARISQDILSSNVRIFQESGAAADEFYAARTADMNNQVAEFQSIGVDQVAIEAWKASEITRINDEMRDYERNAELARLDEQITNSDSFAEIYSLTLDRMRAAQETWGEEASRAVTQMFNSVADGMGKAFAQVLVYGKSMSDVFKGLLQQILSQMIETFIAIGIRRLILSHFEKSAATAAAFGNAFASTAAIPIIGPALAPGVATAAASTVSTTMTGITAAPHGGMDYVPKESTYFLDKGERVLSPNQNKDLTSFLNDGGGGGGVQIGTLHISVLENATTGQALLDMSEESLREVIARKFIPALDALGSMGIKQRALEAYSR